MEKHLIARGLVAGAAGAVLAFLFARVCAEPIIGRAIEYEDGRSKAEEALGGHDSGVDLFSRATQATPGLGFGVLIFGTAMGALFAVLFSLVYARAGRSLASTGHPPEPRKLALRLAAAAFVAVYLVPFLKYPPNPPSIGQPETIGSRTGLYLLMVLISVVLMIAAVRLARPLSARFGRWNGVLLAAGAYVVAVVAVSMLLPPVAETPTPMREGAGAIVYPGFPADVLYEFRLVSLATQLVLWVTIGLVFATLAGRLLGEPAERSSNVAA